MSANYHITILLTDIQREIRLRMNTLTERNAYLILGVQIFTVSGFDSRKTNAI